MKATFARVETSAGPLDLLSVEDLRERFAPHMHEAYAIGVFDRGSYHLRCSGTSYTTGPGHVVALAPGEIHTGAPLGDEGWCTRMFYPDAAVFRRLLGDGGSDDDWHASFTQTLMVDDRLSIRLSNAHAAFMRGNALDGETQLIVALTSLLDRYGVSSTRRRARGTTYSAGMHAVREYIHDNFAAPIRLETLACLAGVSSYHLIRVFGREFGVSPYAYVKQLRVVRAQELLRRGATATEAAFAAGFSDQSHLNRAFKNMLGVTPGAFARAINRATA